MHPGNLFVDDDGRLIAVDFGIMGRLGVKERLFLAEILHGFITRDYHRTAEVHFEAGYVPPHHSVENFAQAIRAIGEPIHNRTAEDISMAKLLTLVVRGHRPVRHAHAAGIAAAAKNHGGGRRRRALARSQARHVDHRRAGGARMDDAASRPRRQAGKRRAGRRPKSGRFVGSAPGLLTRGARVLDQLDAMTRDGLVLSPQTIAEIDKAESRRVRWTMAALWVIAALLLWIAVKVL